MSVLSSKTTRNIPVVEQVGVVVLIPENPKQLLKYTEWVSVQRACVNPVSNIEVVS